MIKSNDIFIDLYVYIHIPNFSLTYHNTLIYLSYCNFTQFDMFLPSELGLTPHFLNNVVDVKTSGLRHVLKLWIEVSKGMLPVKYFCSNKSILRQYTLVIIKRYANIEVNLGTLMFWGYYQI